MAAEHPWRACEIGGSLMASYVSYMKSDTRGYSDWSGLEHGETILETYLQHAV